MSKSSPLAEASPDSQPRPRVAKPRRRKAQAVEPATTTAIVPASSPVKPLLIGLGVGAAIGAAALALGSRARGNHARSPSLGGVVVKATLLWFARAAAQRAVRIAADRAAVSVADAWNPVKLR